MSTLDKLPSPSTRTFSILSDAMGPVVEGGTERTAQNKFRVLQFPLLPFAAAVSRSPLLSDFGNVSERSYAIGPSGIIQNIQRNKQTNKKQRRVRKGTKKRKMKEIETEMQSLIYR